MAHEQPHIKVYVCKKLLQNHEIDNPTAYPCAFFRILTKEYINREYNSRVGHSVSHYLL